MCAVKVLLKKSYQNGTLYKVGDTVTLDEAEAKRLVALEGGEIIPAPLVLEKQEKEEETTVSGVELKDLLYRDYDYEKAGVTEPEQGQMEGETGVKMQAVTGFEEDRKTIVIKTEKEMSRMPKPELIAYAKTLPIVFDEDERVKQIIAKVLGLGAVVEANA